MTKTKIASTVVIKVGTSTLMRRSEDGRELLDADAFTCIGKQIIALRRQGHAVIIVSSAAITAGMVAAHMATRPKTMPALQRLASIGWRHVINYWDAAVETYQVGELLLTSRELSTQDERGELLRVTHELLQHGDIPVANENDAITHEEIAFGDNDTLAATFAARIRQSPLFGDDVKLVLLSDVDGVYEDCNDPKTKLAKIRDIHTYEHIARTSQSSYGTGGMVTKFAAAKIATEHSVPVWLTNGRAPYCILDAFSGRSGTHFPIDA